MQAYEQFELVNTSEQKGRVPHYCEAVLKSTNVEVYRVATSLLGERPSRFARLSLAGGETVVAPRAYAEPI